MREFILKFNNKDSGFPKSSRCIRSYSWRKTSRNCRILSNNWEKPQEICTKTARLVPEFSR